MDRVREILLRIYDKLLSEIGPRGWWPADSPFEVMIGAILTQNTAWANVKKAIKNLKEQGVLSLPALQQIELDTLAQLIRPSGYYNQKARKIKSFVQYLVENYDGSLPKMAQKDTAVLREELLSIPGIGPETADSILLYALQKPTFVVDTYTKRILTRHGLIEDKAGYEQIRSLFLEHLPQEIPLYNEFHALMDYVGHFFCKKNPECQPCPLKDFRERV